MSVCRIWCLLRRTPFEMSYAMQFGQGGAVKVMRRRSCAIWIASVSCVAMLLGATGASAAEPGVFATTTTTCSDGVLDFPVQASAHPNVIFRFKSIGAQGGIGTFGGTSSDFAPGDAGWGLYETPKGVLAGEAPKLYVNCGETGSVEASLAERPGTPATFNGVTTANYFQGSFIPFTAPGTGQYVLNLSISQGAIEVTGIQGILQSGGEYPLGTLEAGAHNLQIDARQGPAAVWGATVSEVPVAINGLSFGRACMAPGKGIPAKFSVTGDTSITASVLSGSGAVVRSLGIFGVKLGDGSIPWDGRNSGGGRVANGVYTLGLTSTDPQGDVTSAQTSIAVARTGPRVKAVNRRRIARKHDLVFSFSDDPCGLTKATVVIDGHRRGVYRGSALSRSGRLLVSPRGYWAPGRNRWRVITVDPVGNRRTTAGVFRVKGRLVTH